MAGTAFSCAIEVGFPRFDIAGEHVWRLIRVPVARCRFDALMKEMRQIENLLLREISRMIRELLHGGPDLVAEPVMQHNDGANQVGTVISALDVASMAVDAVLGINGTAARRRSIIDDLADGGSRLTGGIGGRKKDAACKHEKESPEP
jgi:hypothetical protein